MEDSDREKPWRNSEWDNVKKATKKDFPRSFEIISEIDDFRKRQKYIVECRILLDLLPIM